MILRRDFFARTGNVSLHGVIPLLPQTMQVASVPLGLVATQAQLISRSTRSEKLPFVQKAAVVVVLVDFARKLRGTEGGGVCTRRSEYSSKHPLPSFV